MRLGGQRHASAALPWGKNPYSHYGGGWLGLRACRDGYGEEKISRPPPGLEPRSESVYRLRYPDLFHFK
jgi:hypothetical protein